MKEKKNSVDDSFEGKLSIGDWREKMESQDSTKNIQTQWWNSSIVQKMKRPNSSLSYNSRREPNMWFSTTSSRYFSMFSLSFQRIKSQNNNLEITKNSTVSIKSKERKLRKYQKNLFKIKELNEFKPLIPRILI